jgi:hypothetical protein
MMPTGPLCMLLDIRDTFEPAKMFSVDSYPSDGDADEYDERTQTYDSYVFHAHDVEYFHLRRSFHPPFFGYSAVNVHTISAHSSASRLMVVDEWP